jgi:hypothetical protein
MLLEVIEYLLHHGADPFNAKCEKSGLSAYDFALQNQRAAFKNDPNLP